MQLVDILLTELLAWGKTKKQILDGAGERGVDKLLRRFLCKLFVTYLGKICAAYSGSMIHI